jgi:hypothetical protein
MMLISPIWKAQAKSSAMHQGLRVVNSNSCGNAVIYVCARIEDFRKDDERGALPEIFTLQVPSLRS